MTTIESIEDGNMENESTSFSFGYMTKTIFDEYPIYKFNLPAATINNYLPDKLAAFSAITWRNSAKRHFFYSKPIIFASRCQISKTTEQLSSEITLDDLLEELLLENDPTLRYNFVVMGDCLSLVRLSRHRHVSYHILCKHITLSNRSTDVRFAGELWCDENGRFYLNNNSGTYQPSNRLIKRAVQLFNDLTPSLQFKGVNFQTNIRLSVKHRSIKKRHRNSKALDTLKDLSGDVLPQ